MRQQTFHNTDGLDDRLVVAQTQVEVIGHCQEDEKQHTEPERQTPVTPLERIILYILRTKELIDMGGINLDGKHLQRQTLTLVRLAVDLDRHRRQVIEGIVEGGQRIDSGTGHETIVLRLLRLFLTSQHLDTRRDVLCGLEDRKLHLRILLGMGCQRDVNLLAYEHLNRVDRNFYRFLRSNSQYTDNQYDKNTDSFH